MTWWEHALLFITFALLTEIGARGLHRFIRKPSTGVWWVPFLVLGAAFWIAWAATLVPDIIRLLEGS